MCRALCTVLSVHFVFSWAKLEMYRVQTMRTDALYPVSLYISGFYDSYSVHALYISGFHIMISKCTECRDLRLGSVPVQFTQPPKAEARLETTRTLQDERRRGRTPDKKPLRNLAQLEKPKKCVLAAKEVKVLGHIVNQ